MLSLCEQDFTVFGGSVSLVHSKKICKVQFDHCLHLPLISPAVPYAILYVYHLL